MTIAYSKYKIRFVGWVVDPADLRQAPLWAKNNAGDHVINQLWFISQLQGGHVCVFLGGSNFFLFKTNSSTKI